MLKIERKAGASPSTPTNSPENAQKPGRSSVGTGQAQGTIPTEGSNELVGVDGASPAATSQGDKSLIIVAAGLAPAFRPLHTCILKFTLTFPPSQHAPLIVDLLAPPQLLLQHKKLASIVGTGLVPVRKMVAHLYQMGHNVPPTCFRTGTSPVPTIRLRRSTHEISIH